MLLWEINDNKMLVKLVAIASKIKHSLKHKTHKEKPWMKDKESFLEYLSDHGLTIDEDDLQDMIESGKGPLSQVITGFDGENIQWKTDEPEQAEANGTTDLAAADAEFQQQQNDAIVSNMAKQALPK